jgi:hypothetical protein
MILFRKKEEIQQSDIINKIQRISSLTEKCSFSKTPLHRDGRLYEGDELKRFPRSSELNAYYSFQLTVNIFSHNARTE